MLAQLWPHDYCGRCLSTVCWVSNSVTENKNSLFLLCATRCFLFFLRGGDGSCYIVVQAKVPEQARADTQLEIQAVLTAPTRMRARNVQQGAKKNCVKPTGLHCLGCICTRKQIRKPSLTPPHLCMRAQRRLPPFLPSHQRLGSAPSLVVSRPTALPPR